MALVELAKQKILIDDVFDDYHTENELIQSTAYELVPIYHTEDNLLAHVSSETVAIINVRIQLTPQLISKLPPSIKVITKLSSGYDNIDVAACRQRGIKVCYVPEYGINTIADHAVGLLFAAHRRLLTYHSSIIDKHQWNRNVVGRLHDLNVMTLGVIGCGRIGTCFAEKMHPFVKRILTLGMQRTRSFGFGELGFEFGFVVKDRVRT